MRPDRGNEESAVAPLFGAGPMLRAAKAAVRAADPAAATRAALPEIPAEGRVAVFALGKAAAPMAAAVAEAWGEALGARLVGVAVSPETVRSIGPFRVIQGAHPVPNDGSEQAARAMLDLAETLGPEDFALALVSGGGSALAVAPIEGVSLSDKQALNDALLASGASIDEINAVRKRFSAFKGGRLAQAIAPARLLTLAVSDVPGDDPAVIASGPTAPDPSTLADARRVALKYGLGGPEGPRLALPTEPGAERATPVRYDPKARGQESFRYLPADRLWREASAETPKPGDPAFEQAEFKVIVAPAQSLAAAEAALRAEGWTVEILGAEIEGPAAEIGAKHARIALTRRAAGRRVALLSGGELTVTLSAGSGRGGPNREYALALALGLDGAEGVRALAIDTDGADGAPSVSGDPVAGALILPDTLRRVRERGLDPEDHLARHDSGSLFAAIGDDLRTGLTGTNVNDLRIILVDGS
ncbi:MAG: DUF4147 domain-containing protein [Pseudomonadota bacterium]